MLGDFSILGHKISTCVIVYLNYRSQTIDKTVWWPSTTKCSTFFNGNFAQVKEINDFIIWITFNSETLHTLNRIYSFELLRYSYVTIRQTIEPFSLINKVINLSHSTSHSFHSLHHPWNYELKGTLASVLSCRQPISI